MRGFSRGRHIPDASMWRSHDGLVVISSLNHAYLPGTQDTEIGPQWHVSVSRAPERSLVADVERVVECFGMPAFDEDNHHPGIARHLWCPVDERYRQGCECKLTEQLIVDGDYQWTTDVTAECRGCQYQKLFGPPCPIHQRAEVSA